MFQLIVPEKSKQWQLHGFFVYSLLYIIFCRSKEFIRQRKLVAESTPHAKELSYTGSSSSQSAHKTMHVFSQSPIILNKNLMCFRCFGLEAT